MDIFDAGDYFSSQVPVQARTWAVLRHSLSAYAAKQLHLAGNLKAVVGGTASTQATMETYNIPTQWDLVAIQHYDDAIGNVRGLMSSAEAYSPTSSSSAFVYRDPLGNFEIGGPHRPTTATRQQSHTGPQIDMEQAAAAVTILGVYEFVSATGTAWSAHLDGAKKLLDVAGPLARAGPNPIVPSEGWRAIFWQLARQDYLAACKSRPLLPNQWHHLHFVA